MGAGRWAPFADVPLRLRRLMEAGVDGIISDRPDLLREVFLARGCWTAS